MKPMLDLNTNNLINVLQSNGFSAYAVGGCVRDGIMGRDITDFDITTSALPQQVKEVFSNYKTIETGIQHGTVTVIVNGAPYEITTFRTEDIYTDSRHPDSVIFVSDIKTDLSRRDFTMNAIAYNEKEGIVDPFNGIADIENKQIRTVGSPSKRFQEDSLRILRALRFSSVLGFEIEDKTAVAINNLAHTVNNVSPERIYVEIKKLLCGKNAHNVVKKFTPALREIISVKDDISRLSNLPKDFPMRLYYLCGASTAEVLKKLRADNKTKRLCKLISESSPIPNDETQLKFYISNLGREVASYVIKYRKSVFGEDKCNKSEEILNKNLCLTVCELAINGDDILSLGIQGKSIHKAQKYLLSSVIKGEIPNQREVLLETLKNLDISVL